MSSGGMVGTIIYSEVSQARFTPVVRDPGQLITEHESRKRALVSPPAG